MPEGATPLSAIRRRLIHDLFALPAEREAGTARDAPMPEPAGDRHVEASEAARAVCTGVLASFGYDRAQTPPGPRIVYYKEVGNGLYHFVQLQWHEGAEVFDPASDLVELDARSAPDPEGLPEGDGGGPDNGDSAPSGDGGPEPPF
jgi:hypothetical protein